MNHHDEVEESDEIYNTSQEHSLYFVTHSPYVLKATKKFDVERFGFLQGNSMEFRAIL